MRDFFCGIYFNGFTGGSMIKEGFKGAWFALAFISVIVHIITGVSWLIHHVGVCLK